MQRISAPSPHLLERLEVGLRWLGDGANADEPLWDEPDPGDQELRDGSGCVQREDVEDLLVGAVIAHVEGVPGGKVEGEQEQVGVGAAGGRAGRAGSDFEGILWPWKVFEEGAGQY